jgi:hypothetical protein
VKEENCLEPWIWALPPPLVCFFKTLQNQIKYKTNNNATKTSNTEDIEEYQEKRL